MDYEANGINPGGPTDNPGRTETNTDYGNYEPKKWRGVPSAKAL
jgi:hypothetical protein